MKRFVAVILLAVLFLAIAPEVHAACVNPAGNAGDMIYNRDSRAPQYCNGGMWVNTGSYKYAPNAAFFDGEVHYMNKTAVLTGSGLTGVNNITGSFWFWTTGRYGLARDIFSIFSNTNSRFEILLTTGDKLQFLGTDTGGTPNLSLTGSTAITDSKWHHVMFSFDLTNPAHRYIYLDDVAETLAVTTYNNATVDFAPATTPKYTFGRNPVTATATPFVGGAADFWLNAGAGTYLDLSSATNQALFINTATKLPVSLGATGSTPTGTAPLIFFNGAGNNFAVNNGTGGAFTRSGTIATAAYGPTATGATVTRLNELTGATFWKAERIATQGNYAYVSASKDASNNYLSVVNISNPASLALSGSVNNTNLTTGAYGVIADNNYVYVAGTKKISTVDVTNPAAPSWVAGYANNYICSNGDTCALAKYGSTLFATDKILHVLTAVSASAPTALSLLSPSAPFSTSVSSVLVGTGAKNFTVQTGLSYVAAQNVIVIDQASPANWMHCTVTTYTSGTGALALSCADSGGAGTMSAWNMYLTADKTNAGAGATGLGGPDSSQPNSSDVIVDASGQYLYSSYYDSGISIMDVSNPASPVIKGNDDSVTGGYAAMLAQDPLHPNQLYETYTGCSGAAGIANVASKTAPTQSGMVNGVTWDCVSDPNNQYGIKVSGNKLVIVKRETPHIAVYDLTNATTTTPPVLVATSGTAACSSCFDVAVSGNYAFTTERVSSTSGGVVSWQINDGGTCSSPAANEGDMMYNNASHAMQFCNGASWIGLGPVTGAGSGNCASPVGAEGAMIYDSTISAMTYCNGTNWIAMGSSYKGLQNGLIGWWKLDDGSGASGADSSGNSNTLTLSNSPTWTAAGQFNGALTFNGTNQSMQSPSINLNAKTVTVSMWVNRTYVAGTANLTPLIEFSTNMNTNYPALAMFADDKTDCGIDKNIQIASGGFSSGNHYNSKCYTEPTSGAWHMLTAVYDTTQSVANEVSFYIDGVFQTPSAVINSDDNTNVVFGNQPFYFFARGGSSLYGAGTMDDVRVYTRALSAAEVMRLYTATGGP